MLSSLCFLLFLVSTSLPKKGLIAQRAAANLLSIADQLRQSSDDLTQMARAFVVVGDPRFKKYYQHILDIRDGKKTATGGIFLRLLGYGAGKRSITKPQKTG